jgi:hypothetical protein
MGFNSVFKGLNLMVDKVTTGENYIMKSLMICTPYLILCDGPGTWGVGGGERCAQGFGGEA